LPYFSEVLPVHTALLHTGKVLFFAGSGNNAFRFRPAFLGDERVPEDERNDMITALKNGSRVIVKSLNKPRIILPSGG
jgi:hypothetical protein